MNRKTKTATRKTAQRPRASKPLQWSDVSRWLQWLDTSGFSMQWRRAHIDQRLVTIAPAFEGLIEGLQGYPHQVPSERQRAALAVAKQAVGTTTNPFDGDERRVLVVCDWMLRHALPLWLDRLPQWCSGDTSASRLRACAPLQWTHTIVEALSTLSPIWMWLGTAAQRGTEDEMPVISAVHKQCEAAMRVLAAALPATLGIHTEHDREAWICSQSLLLVEDRIHNRLDPSVAASVEQLVGVLLQVQPRDSQSSVAHRCQWKRPTRKAAA